MEFNYFVKGVPETPLGLRSTYMSLMGVFEIKSTRIFNKWKVQKTSDPHLESHETVYSFPKQHKHVTDEKMLRSKPTYTDELMADEQTFQYDDSISKVFVHLKYDETGKFPTLNLTVKEGLVSKISEEITKNVAEIMGYLDKKSDGVEILQVPITEKYVSQIG